MTRKTSRLFALALALALLGSAGCKLGPGFAGTYAGRAQLVTVIGVSTDTEQCTVDVADADTRQVRVTMRCAEWGARACVLNAVASGWLSGSVGLSTVAVVEPGQRCAMREDAPASITRAVLSREGETLNFTLITEAPAQAQGVVTRHFTGTRRR